MYVGKANMGMHQMKSLFLILSLCFVLTSYSLARETKVNSSLDTNAGLIGDQIILTLQAKSNQKTNIVFPAIKDSIGGMEILEYGSIDTSRTTDGRILSQKFKLTCFDSGRYEVPQYTFMYDREGMDELYPIETKALSVKFNTMEIDTSIAIRDIKSPLDEPHSLWDY
jgi:hypothetical protein